VSFTYPGAQRRVLDDVTIDIPRGQTVAVVGETGAGKTTLASLLLRFFEPDTGKISVSGAPLGTLDVAWWRTQIAWVPQRPHLFTGTIAQNIALARPDASGEEIVAAAKAAGLDDLLQRLPAGLATPVGERGARLSGGERQRVAIARAFLKDAPILVLDEVTSQLDVESEAIIRRSIERLRAGRTVLLIAHRLSLAYGADQVVVIDDGRVVEAGSHDALIVRNSAYRALVADYDGGMR
jgi:ABC-type multidrug transport system fused ATPase/permease subunit